MNNLAEELHKIAMDLSTLGSIYKAKGLPYVYDDYLEFAFLIDKKAAILIQESEENGFERAAYPRSAAWLAYKNGKYADAKALAELGLTHRDSVSGYEVTKLEELLSTVNSKITESSLKDEKNEAIQHFHGVVASANVDEQHLKIRQSDKKKYKLVKVASDKILDIARLFIGETVEVAAQKDESGSFILQHIQRTT